MKIKKKVLLDLERMRYPNSGIANVFRNLAKGLNDIHVSTDLDISIYGPYENLQKIISNFNIVARRAIHKVISLYSFGYDVLHTSHQLSSYFHFKFPNQKKIVTLHDLNFLHEDVSDKKLKKELGKVRKNIENADVIVCISEFTKKDLIANQHLFNYKSTPEIVVIHNGLQFPEIKSYQLGPYKFLADKKYIIYIGVLFPKKNQLSLIKMLPFIEEDLVLVVSGEKESYKNEILTEIEKLNISDRVHIVRNISEEEKWALIQNATSMCHPSLAEGFGIPPIEAMYFGKPVFLSNLTSLPEIGGQLANYFSSFETAEMVKVYKSGIQTHYSNELQLIKELNQWALKYNYLEMAKNYLSLYNRILK
jgi:glycosyltransferase involved in cell wall biosynthesis